MLCNEYIFLICAEHTWLSSIKRRGTSVVVRHTTQSNEMSVRSGQGVQVTVLLLWQRENLRWQRLVWTHDFREFSSWFLGLNHLGRTSWQWENTVDDGSSLRVITEHWERQKGSRDKTPSRTHPRKTSSLLPALSFWSFHIKGTLWTRQQAFHIQSEPLLKFRTYSKVKSNNWKPYAKNIVKTQ